MKAVQITSQNIEATLSSRASWADFWAPWCGPCLRFAPVFEAAAERHPDHVWSVNTAGRAAVGKGFEISAIPTLAIFRDNILLFKEPGMLPAAALDQLVEKVASLDMDEVRAKLDQET